ncbi:MAG: glycosyltransferase, partial [Thermoanaerobaculia bacterium]
MKLLLFATHPIQYQAPWFRALAVHPEIDLTVAFGMLPSAEEQAVGFDVAFEWDLPLLDGYRSIQLELAAGRRSISSFRGIRVRNLDAVLEREVADLVLVTGWNSWMLVQAANAAKRRGIPLIVRGESNDLRRRPAGVRWLQRRFLARFDACLAIGSANRRFLEARGIAPERIFDTPYFVDNARFVDAAAKLEGQREGIRNRWS